jgi:hypothetical protein
MIRAAEVTNPRDASDFRERGGGGQSFDSASHAAAHWRKHPTKKDAQSIVSKIAALLSSVSLQVGMIRL